MQKIDIFTPSYNIVEIFESLQGEGFNTGMPSIFVRFGKCNLACPWCDTNYNQFERMTLAQIMEEVRSFSAKNIIITGGEPTIVPNIELLLNQMKSEGYFLAIETNGLKPIPTQIDYIATSPKRLYQHKYEQRCIEFAGNHYPIGFIKPTPQQTQVVIKCTNA